MLTQVGLAFNTHAIVSENRCTKIDNSKNPELASFGCAITTGFGVVENNANIEMGESVVVLEQEELD